MNHSKKMGKIKKKKGPKGKKARERAKLDRQWGERLISKDPQYSRAGRNRSQVVDTKETGQHEEEDSKKDLAIEVQYDESINQLVSSLSNRRIQRYNNQRNVGDEISSRQQARFRGMPCRERAPIKDHPSVSHRQLSPDRISHEFDLYSDHFDKSNSVADDRPSKSVLSSFGSTCYAIDIPSSFFAKFKALGLSSQSVNGDNLLDSVHRVSQTIVKSLESHRGSPSFENLGTWDQSLRCPFLLSYCDVFLSAETTEVSR